MIIFNKTLFLLLTLMISMKLVGQKKDSISNIVFKNFLELKPLKTEYKWCDKFMKTASRMCNNDSLVLPIYTNKFWPEFSTDINSITCKELLKREYGFIEKDMLDGGDLVPHYIFCFEEYTIRFVQNKFGVTFFRDRKIQADSMDAMGIGYIPPKPKKKCHLIEKQLKKKMKSSKILFMDKEKIRVLRFKILQDGSISNISYKITYYDGGLLDSKHDKYQKEIIQVISEIPKWYPATYRGKPIDSEVTFVINETFR